MTDTIRFALFLVSFGAFISLLGMLIGLRRNAAITSGDSTTTPSVSRGRTTFLVAGMALAVVLIITQLTAILRGSAGTYSQQTKEIRAVVRESQLFETLTMYQRPGAYQDPDLSKYWLSEPDGGKAGAEVRQRMANLLKSGRSYGPNSRNERFDFISAVIDASGTRATVETDEAWVLEIVRDGKVAETKRLHYPVRYTLRKVGERWLIETNSTPTAKRVSP